MIGFVSETAVDAYQHRHDRLLDEIGEARRAWQIAPTAARLQALELLEAQLARFRKDAARTGIRLNRYL